MAYRNISEETKQQVIAALLVGQPVNATARRFHLSPATVSRIRVELSQERMKAMQAAQNARIDDLLYDCLSQHIAALSAIAHFTADLKYLRRQKAGDVARLYSAVSDTFLRLLEAAALWGFFDEPGRKIEMP